MRTSCWRWPTSHAVTDPQPITARDLWSTARLILSTKDVDSREIRAGVLLLAAATSSGPNLRQLREFTRIPWRDITHASYYLRRAGIWQQDRVEAPWLEEGGDPDTAVVSFTLHVLVATGEVVRHTGDRYSIRTVGEVLEVESGIPWREIVPARQLRVTDAEPAWVAASSG